MGDYNSHCTTTALDKLQQLLEFLQVPLWHRQCSHQSDIPCAVPPPSQVYPPPPPFQNQKHHALNDSVTFLRHTQIYTYMHDTHLLGIWWLWVIWHAFICSRAIFRYGTQQEWR